MPVTINGTTGITSPAYFSTAQSGFFASIANTSDTTIAQGVLVPFNTVTATGAFNTGTNFNVSTSLYTAPVAGRYFFSYTLFLSNSGGATFAMQAAIRVNGSFQNFSGGDAYGVLQGQPNNTQLITLSFSGVLNLSANDTVGVAARSASGVRIYPGHCNFSGYLLG